MQYAATITRVIWRGCIIALIGCHLGCKRVLSPGAASVLAAKLANDECERLYKKRPFNAGQHPAVLEGDTYRWGHLDPGGPSGFSAVVTFRTDGGQSDVQVYFSTDMLTDMLTPAVAPKPPVSPAIPDLKR
jgi:hypothetical protein